MSRIKIKNFGPIKRGYLENDGWLDIRKVTLLIGNQGSGKSTVAKLISCFKWIEKALTRGDFNVSWFEQNDRFRTNYCAFHRLQNYFYDDSFVGYKGDSYNLEYKNGQFSIKEISNETYLLPQIIYVPAERNFISTIKSPQLLKLSSEPLIEFLTEFEEAKLSIQNGIALPINNAEIKYNQYKDLLYIEGNDYQVLLTESSSGFQSLVPLYLVSRNLANSVQQSEKNKQPMSSDELNRFKKGVADIWSNNSFTDEQRRAAISVLSSKFNRSAFINIVEEPEQNLFPKSQQLLLNSLLKLNNAVKGNELIMTTHSPYMINYLTIAIQGMALQQKINASENINGALAKLNSVVPENATISASDVAIYQLNEVDGSIEKLENYEGIPSDDNYLNQSLAIGNELFDSLLEIEQGL